MTTVPLARLRDLTGTELGPTGWQEVGQDRIDAFADATGDHQWIHTDPGRAASGPFGGTVAHGYLTLSLVAAFMQELLRVDGANVRINYGLGKVRFPAALRAGSRVRARLVVRDVDERPDGTVQATYAVTVEADGSAKPVCVAEAISRYAE
ncbi:MaoC family dehydratase [Actinomadura sp. WMMB 499]|uniref:MaoC family dehydratase n=1 Tax=Actinomadura sp. WMMB 499 TaxID=1219491 RepID=UPI001245D414|nr:MaoC family dehydratase [Actinomadura sp. WMMB 499]QFG26179.1 MaoC family dehydratase [Actinomadura sp. WMMB 499]